MIAKEKVTLTLTGENLAALRSLVGSRSLSASIDRAIAEYLTRMKHRSAVDAWLAELDAAHGPIPPEAVEWAGRLVDGWARRTKQRKAG